MSSLAPGTEIGGYAILRTLSEAGAFSLVYCARPLSGSHQVVVKESFPAGAAFRDDDGKRLRARDRSVFDWARERFEREAEFLRRHRHPHLVRVLEPPIRDNGTSYMVMEYLTGGSLRDRIERWGRQNEEQVRSWLDEVLAALESVERVGTSHLDLSPDNIMFRGTGEAVLVDFGSARLAGFTPTRGTRMITNRGYSAPEKMSRTSREIDARADVYSLSATVNFAMTGREPAPAHDRLVGLPGVEPGSAAARSGSRAFLAAIDTGFELAPDDRFAGAADFRRALGAPGRERTGEARPRPTAADAGTSGDRRLRTTVRALLAFATLCILFVVVILI